MHVSKGGVTLGRSSAADVVLDDAKVSRTHLEVRSRGGGLHLRDLGSHNGTCVNGAPRTESDTRPGDVVRLGETLAIVVGDAIGHETAPVRSGSLVGGRSLEAVRADIRAAARSETTVLILGDTGTGKERVARAIHERSDRAGEFVAVNCGALPQNLVESELFGHARGAFSGAEAARPGLFRSASGGTLLLDELGELPALVQVKLLRVLEERQVRPVGSDTAVAIDVRVVAATHRHLDEEVRAGRFRRDLYHRLAALTVTLPSLIERREDIPLLVSHFMADSGVLLGADELETLMLRAWPGNVRELAQTLAAAVARARASGEPVTIPRAPRNGSEPGAGPQTTSGIGPDDIERALTEARGNVAEAARRLSMRRASLYQQMKRHGIDPGAFRA